MNLLHFDVDPDIPSPVIPYDGSSDGIKGELTKGDLNELEFEQEGSDVTPTSSSDDGLFAKSSRWYFYLSTLMYITVSFML